jgi:nucleoside-diphosphate-sugar epimerase
MGDTIAVTGANGWLGGHLCRFATSRALGVRGIVRSASAAATVERCGADARLVAGLEVEELRDALQGCVAVAHLAGISAERGEETYAGINVQGTRGVIAAALAAGVRRVVFLSGLGVAHYGQRRRVTNGYFLAKLLCEAELLSSGLDVCILRPSYIVGPDDELVPALLAELGDGPVEVVEDGSHRMQPVAIDDACDAIVRGCIGAQERHVVFDLVGPEPVSYRTFALRLAAQSGRDASSVAWRNLPEEEADRRAATGGYRGLQSDELDVLLCDETADARPLEAWLGRALCSLDDVIRVARRGSVARPGGAYRRAATGVARST